MPRTRSPFWRALAAFLVLPAIVAFVVPWLLAPECTKWHPIGVPIVGGGGASLLKCVGDFHVSGGQSLAPWALPQRLVEPGNFAQPERIRLRATVVRRTGAQDAS